MKRLNGLSPTLRPKGSDYLDESFFEEEEVEESTYDDADDDNSDEALLRRL